MPTPASPRFTLLTASLVCALIILDTNIVAVSLPSIARDLSGSFADIEWVVSAYLLAFAACLLPDTGARNIDSLLNQQILPVLSQQLLQRQASQRKATAVTLGYSADDGIALAFSEEPLALERAEV